MNKLLHKKIIFIFVLLMSSEAFAALSCINSLKHFWRKSVTDYYVEFKDRNFSREFTYHFSSYPPPSKEGHCKDLIALMKCSGMRP